MATAEETIGVHLRASLNMQLFTWRAERERLLGAADRIKELDALIAAAEDEKRDTFPLAPRTAVPLPAPVTPARTRT